MPHTPADMVASVRSQTLDKVMEAYNTITEHGPSSDMDKTVLEQAPLMAAEAVRRETDTNLVQHLARLEQERLERGSAAVPAWSVWANALIDEALERHPEINQTLINCEDNPDYSGPLHAAADALNNIGKEHL